MRALLAATVSLVACGGGKTTASEPLGNTTGGPTSVAPAASDVSPSGAQPSGPGHARVVQRTQNGGLIELDGYRPAAMVGAHDEMASHCGPANYTIPREGEESAAVYDAATNTMTRTLAWRVHYQCAASRSTPASSP